MMYDEQQEEIKRHEEALAAYSRRADLAGRLVALRREGSCDQEQASSKVDAPVNRRPHAGRLDAGG